MIIRLKNYNIKHLFREEIKKIKQHFNLNLQVFPLIIFYDLLIIFKFLITQHLINKIES